MTNPREIKVVLAEDHPVVRQGYAALLNEHPRIRIIAEAGNGKELLELVKKSDVDVVVTDLEMPIMNGDEAFLIIRQRFPHVKVIVLSMYYEKKLIVNFISKGARAYLGKGCDIDELEKAICAVHDTGHYFNEESSLAMCNELKGKFSYTAFTKLSLTEREVEILKLLCEDKSNKEIGIRLNIETRTVDFHRQNIYKKTNCKKPAGLALYAVKNGIIAATGQSPRFL